MLGTSAKVLWMRFYRAKVMRLKLRNENRQKIFFFKKREIQKNLYSNMKTTIIQKNIHK